MQAQSSSSKDRPDCPSQPRVSRPDSRLPGVEPSIEDSVQVPEHFKEHGREFSGLALWPAFTLVTIITLFTIATAWYGPKRLAQMLLNYLMPSSPEAWHGIAIWATIVVCTTCAIPVLLLLLPVPALMLGFWKGFLVIFAALMCGAALSFFIGRGVARRPVRAYLEGNRFTRVLRALHVMEDAQETSMRLLILYRFLPIPMGVRNYGPAILEVSIPKLILASLPHSAWSSLVFATAGSALQGPAEALRDGNVVHWRSPHWQHIVGLVVAAISFVLFTWLAWRAYSEKADDEEERRHGVQDVTSSLAEPSRSELTDAEGGTYGATADAYY